MQLRGKQDRDGRRGRSGGRRNLRYILVLVFLMLFFIWLLTVNMEPWLETFLMEEVETEAPCQMESGDVKQVNDIIFATLKNESDLLWMAHPSGSVGECAFREAGEEGLFKIPFGLVSENQESDLPGFTRISETSFRILEEIYCQIYDWHREYDEMRVVSGIFYCADTAETDITGWNMFTALYIPEVDDGTSIIFLWNDEDEEKPLSELVFSLELLNQTTGLEVFSDIAARRGLPVIPELEGLLGLGYKTEYYNERIGLTGL